MDWHTQILSMHYDYPTNTIMATVNATTSNGQFGRYQVSYTITPLSSPSLINNALSNAAQMCLEADFGITKNLTDRSFFYGGGGCDSFVV